MSSAVSATLDCARVLLTEGQLSDAEIEPGLELIRKHGLAPLAFVAGAKSCRRDYAAGALSAAQRDRAVRDAVGMLVDQRIDVCLLKGMSYAGDIYSDAALRPMGDIDVMVRGRDMARAQQALIRHGYQDMTPGGATPWHHAVQLGGKPWSLDLHRNIVQPWRSRIDLDEVWERMRPAADVDGARRLDPVDQLLFHDAHLARSELFAPLVAFVDEARLRRRLDRGQQRELVRRARRYRLQRSCMAAEAMTRALADDQVRPKLPLWGRLLPSRRDLAATEMPRRSVQLVRKAVLNDDWGQVAGLAAVYSVRHVVAMAKRRWI